VTASSIRMVRATELGLIAIIGLFFALVVAALVLPTPVRAGEVAENQGVLKVLKVDDETGQPLAGAVFTVEGQQGTFVTDANGLFCIDGLPNGSEWLVTEIQAPPGYLIAEPSSSDVNVEVDSDAGCDIPDDSPNSIFRNARQQVVETPAQTPAATPVQTTVQTPAAVATPQESALGGVGRPRVPLLPNTATSDAAPGSQVMGLLLLASVGMMIGVRLARRRAARG
jgi:hypothetical protein